MKSVDVNGLKRALESDPQPVLIDVRSGFEFAGGHVPQAVNVPLGSLPSRAAEWKGKGTIYVICQAGNRSQQGTRILEQAGVDAVNVSGGTGAWIGQGHGVKREKSLATLAFPLLACLTLGLAPFNPPHLIGKLQWVAGGAVGMGVMDWFDLVLHGAPWVWLAVSIARYLATPAE